MEQNEIETRIGLEIYRANRDGKICHRDYIFDILSPLGITMKDIDRCLTKMSDICMIDEDWATLEDNRWVKSIRMTIEYISRFKGLDIHLQLETFYDEHTINNESKGC